MVVMNERNDFLKPFRYRIDFRPSTGAYVLTANYGGRESFAHPTVAPGLTALRRAVTVLRANGFLPAGRSDFPDPDPIEGFLPDGTPYDM